MRAWQEGRAAAPTLWNPRAARRGEVLRRAGHHAIRQRGGHPRGGDSPSPARLGRLRATVLADRGEPAGGAGQRRARPGVPRTRLVGRKAQRPAGGHRRDRESRLPAARFAELLGSRPGEPRLPEDAARGHALRPRPVGGREGTRMGRVARHQSSMEAGELAGDRSPWRSRAARTESGSCAMPRVGVSTRPKGPRGWPTSSARARAPPRPSSSGWPSRSPRCGIRRCSTSSRPAREAS